MISLMVIFVEVITRGWQLFWNVVIVDPVGALIIVGIVLTSARIVAKRNHLDARRVKSNLIQMVVGLAGWLTLTFYYIGRNGKPTDDVILIQVYTVILVLSFCAGILVAAGVKRYAPAPGSRLRADIARGFIWVAERIADKKYYQEVYDSAFKLVNSLDVIESAVSEKKARIETTTGVG